MRLQLQGTLREQILGRDLCLRREYTDIGSRAVLLPSPEVLLPPGYLTDPTILSEVWELLQQVTAVMTSIVVECLRIRSVEVWKPFGLVTLLPNDIVRQHQDIKSRGWRVRLDHQVPHVHQVLDHQAYDLALPDRVRLFHHQGGTVRQRLQHPL